MLLAYSHLQRILTILAIIGIGLMFLAACFTVFDIIFRSLFDFTVHGLVDLTQLAMMYAVFMSIAYGYASQAHVAVTILTDHFPARLQSLIAAFWWLVGAAILCILTYAAFLQAQAIYQYGDVSQNISIPMAAYWTPVIVGLALSILGCWIAVVDSLKGEHPPSNDNIVEGL